MLWPDGIHSHLASDETYTISYSVRLIASELYSSNIALESVPDLCTLLQFLLQNCIILSSRAVSEYEKNNNRKPKCETSIFPS